MALMFGWEANYNNESDGLLTLHQRWRKQMLHLNITHVVVFSRTYEDNIIGMSLMLGYAKEWNYKC